MRLSLDCGYEAEDRRRRQRASGRCINLASEFIGPARHTVPLRPQHLRCPYVAAQFECAYLDTEGAPRHWDRYSSSVRCRSSYRTTSVCLCCSTLSMLALRVLSL